MKKKSANLDNGVAFVANLIDASSSISHYGLERAMSEMINLTNGGIKENALHHGVRTSMSMYTFASTVLPVFENIDSQDVAPYNEYKSYGNTKLFDCVLHAINRFKEFAKIKPNDKDSFLVLLITDGEDTSSLCNIASVVREMRELAATGRWTFAFQVPKATLSRDYKQNMVRNYGIPEGNIREWEISQAGVREAAAVQTQAVGSYMDNTTKGVRSTTELYGTDMSKVSVKKVARVADIVTPQFRNMAVAGECVIKDFVEGKTKKEYVIGSAYYQLQKKEKIQGHKQLLLIEKGTKKVYGGAGVRDLLGLPDGTVTVNPGNHGNWDIFVQSTSVNRKLVRGSRLLLDKTKITNSKPTWDHNKAHADKVTKGSKV